MISIRSTAMAFSVLLLLMGQLQAQKIDVGFIGGPLMSQLDGDGYTGYNRSGFQLGMRAELEVGPKADLIIELLYARKGSKFESGQPNNDAEKNRAIYLDFAEIPLLIRLFHKAGREGIYFEAGISLATLVREQYLAFDERAKVDIYQSLEGKLKRSDINMIFSVGHQFNRTVGIFFRPSFGLTTIYKRPPSTDEEQEENFQQWIREKESDERLNLLRNYLISAGVVVII